MKSVYSIALFIVIFVVGVIISSEAATPYHGNLKLGYIYTDDDGNRSVMQPSFNLYEGAALSLDNFSWKFDNGTRLTANFRNVTLNNRNLTARLSRSGQYGVALTHYQYRRVYNFDGGDFTRRRLTSADLWIQPFKQIRLFGGLGYETKHGNGIELYEPSGLQNSVSYNYNRTRYHAGIRFSQQRAVVQAEYLGSTSNAESGSFAARDSRRYKITASSPVPKLAKVLLHGGFQHYEWQSSGAEDKLSSNTVWGGGRFAVTKGLAFKYSFVFDRAKYVADPIATDNISHALTAEHLWPQKAGISAGYIYRTNDNLTIEKSTNSYMASGWYQLTPEIKVQGGFGSVREDLQEGITLTGAGDFTRYYGGLKYLRPDLQMSFKVESRYSSNDEIGSTADLVRIGSDVQFGRKSLGNMLVSYTYQRGDYKNAENAFAFDDHIINAEVTTVYVGSIQATARGTYYRSKRDLNVESFSVGLTGRYRLSGDLSLEAGYNSYTYDDLLLTTATYTRYYSVNVVEAKLIKSF